jgi:monovalent cation/proton antiporter MnhG/PhaG subunit
MSFDEIVTLVLVALGVGFLLTGVVGVIAADNVYDRLHFTGPASIFGPILIALAVVIDFGPFSQAGLKTGLTALLVIGLNPVLVHATARAARIRERGELGYDTATAAKGPEAAP